MIEGDRFIEAAAAAAAAVHTLNWNWSDLLNVLCLAQMTSSPFFTQKC